MRFLAFATLMILPACMTKEEAENRKWASERMEQRAKNLCSDFCQQGEYKLLKKTGSCETPKTCVCADGRKTDLDL